VIVIVIVDWRGNRAQRTWWDWDSKWVGEGCQVGVDVVKRERVVVIVIVGDAGEAYGRQ